jgi:1,2-phenylacetyl-CoA epoxidase PaaB subunit
MSNPRDNVPVPSGDLPFSPEGDLTPYVIFTQLKEGGPHIYAGWLDAADDAMALQFAKEHYGQDQECVNILAIPRDAIAGTEAEHPTSSEEGPKRTFRVFTQKAAGDQHFSAIAVEAKNSEEALTAARSKLDNADALHSIWVVPQDRIAVTAEGDLIWRYTDQNYRFARGYSKGVRAKWEKIRAADPLAEYEKDDLKETF